MAGEQEQIFNPIRYAGEYYDAESGLYYLRARYYDPTIGRFISEDSYEGDITNPLSLNLYTYCYNNPLIYIDPDGHECGAITIPDKNYNISIKEWADTGLFIITFMPTPAGAAAKAGAKVTQVIVKGSITRKAANKIISLGSKNGPGAVKRVLGNSRIVRTGKGSSIKINLQLFSKDLTKGISKKILNGNKVDISKFKNGKFKQFILEKDRALNSGAGTHGGSYWKLKIEGKRGYWTLDKMGNILRRKD